MQHAHNWVLWSEELHRHLQATPTHGTEPERKQRRALAAARTRFESQHRDLQSQLLAQQTLIVTLLLRGATGDEDGQAVTERRVQAVIARWQSHLVRLLDPSTRPLDVPGLGDANVAEESTGEGLSRVSLWPAGGDRVMVRLAHHAHVQAVVEWLSGQAEVGSVEPWRDLQPHVAHGMLAWRCSHCALLVRLLVRHPVAHSITPIAVTHSITLVAAEVPCLWVHAPQHYTARCS